MSEERMKMDRNEEYPNDKETQEWMNGSMGTPMKRESKQHRMEACPECDAEHQETVKFWMDKWEKRSDEFYALESENKELNQKLSELQAELKEAREIQNGVEERSWERVKALEKERDHLKIELKHQDDYTVELADQIEVLRLKIQEAIKVSMRTSGGDYAGRLDEVYVILRDSLSPAPSKPDERNCKIHNDFVFRFGRPHCNPCNRYLDEPAPSEKCEHDNECTCETDDVVPREDCPQHGKPKPENPEVRG